MSGRLQNRKMNEMQQEKENLKYNIEFLLCSMALPDSVVYLKVPKM